MLGASIAAHRGGLIYQHHDARVDRRLFLATPEDTSVEGAKLVQRAGVNPSADPTGRAALQLAGLDQAIEPNPQRVGFPRRFGWIDAHTGFRRKSFWESP